jgi:hypothetical protein
MRVGILTFAIAVGATASPALAENWRASSKGQGAVAYIDVDSIERKGDRVTFWREIRWPEARSLAGDVRYNRMAALHEGDCKKMTLRSVKVRVSLDGRVVVEGDADDEPEAMEPGSNGEIDLRSACLDQWPED